MKVCRLFVWLALHTFSLFFGDAAAVAQDSRGEGLAEWINDLGREQWGEPPAVCDDLTFARRVYLDLLGRVPSFAELRDFEDMPGEHNP